LQPAIVWFRQDLRLRDNRALTAAVATGRPIVPLYVLDDVSAGPWASGAASRWWLHESLTSLNESLGGTLCCRRGPADQVVPALARELGAEAVFLQRGAEPWRRTRDARIAAALARDDIAWHEFADATLFDPAVVAKPDGTPYRVFTPFYRKTCLQAAAPPREPLPVPTRPSFVRAAGSFAVDGTAGVDGLGLLPRIVWYRRMERSWTPGESGALDRLDRFLDTGLAGYAAGRDRPDQAHVSRLSPSLHFGELSPHQVWHSVLQRRHDPRLERDVDAFLRELVWREFSTYLLWHWPDLPSRNLQPKFDRFPWRDDPESLARWQQGLTGYPLIDAGMRELWSTGYMHTRVRMIVGSFLVKNLLLDWRSGEAWFWDTLVDADLANNSASWQWIAGSGADAAPFFRIFNPVTQAQKFDPAGVYTRRHLPELADVPDEHIHGPWLAPPAVRGTLQYPEPIVDLKASRERALEAWRTIR